jgi:hypothetical protein
MIQVSKVMETVKIMRAIPSVRDSFQTTTWDHSRHLIGQLSANQNH